MMITLSFVALFAAADPTGVQMVELPASAGAGNPREVKAVLDEPHLKLVTITLRKGTKLPPHTAPNPVAIMVLHGAGNLVLKDGTKKRIDPAHMVTLATKVEHAVEPDEGTDMVLLVHHHKSAK